MGDRANVCVKSEEGRVYLYTHWGGSELPEVVRVALARQQRWNDPSYLARIVFCTMVGDGEDLKAETGFGISPAIGDNQIGRPILVLDTEAQVVQFVDATTEAAILAISFEDYVKAEPAQWPGRD